MKKKILFLLLLCCVNISTVLRGQVLIDPGSVGPSENQIKADMIVAQDGSGNYNTIQAAIDAVPENNSSQVIIFIKNGIYNEKIFITKSFVTFIGEDKERTQIIYAELRSDWIMKNDSSDWGSAVINIGNAVTDLIFTDLTIYNNYGSLYGNHDHQFAVRSFDADKIIFYNCSIKADGGDTISLWNAASGKYYLSNCYFEGYVDFVCPRGWCYISNSKFYQLSAKASASIWHDGGADINAKFVIKNSRFEGVDSFSLGRHHRDAQFYLIDCSFAENMKDRPIYHAYSNPPKPYQWGERYFYYNTRKDGGDFQWHKNNLPEAAGSPAPEEITAAWTFSTAPEPWNPELYFKPLLPFLNNSVRVINQQKSD